MPSPTRRSKSDRDDSAQFVPLPEGAERVETGGSRLASESGEILGRNVIGDIELPDTGTYVLPQPYFTPLDYRTVNTPAINKYGGAGFQTVPVDPFEEQRKLWSMIPRLLDTSGARPHEVNKITQHARLLTEAPHAAWDVETEEARTLRAEVQGFNPALWNDPASMQVQSALSQGNGLDPDEQAFNNAALRDAAEMFLNHPEVYDQWMNQLYTNIITSPVQPVDGVGVVGGDLNEVTQKTALFFKENETNLGPELAEYTINALLMVPEEEKILAANGIDPVQIDWFDSMGTFRPWGVEQIEDFATGLEVMYKAPETSRMLIQDPTANVVALLHQYLQQNELKTTEDRLQYIDFLNQYVYASVEQAVTESKGFGAVGANLNLLMGDLVVGNAISDAYSDVFWVNNAAPPEDWINRSNLTAGQNFATSTGVNPSSDSWRESSGTLDGITTVLSSPVNLVAGAGAGVRSTSRIIRPDTVSRGQLFREATRLVPGRRVVPGKGFVREPENVYGKIPLFDSGIVGRYWYATFSKTTQQMIESPQMTKVVNRMVNTSSQNKIARIFPAWAESPKLLKYAAEIDSPELMRELLTSAIRAPELTTMSADAPLMAAHTQARLGQAVDAHRTAVRSVMDEQGASLAHLGYESEVVGHVQVPAGVYDDIAEGRFAATLDNIVPSDGSVETMVTRGGELTGQLDETDVAFGAVRRDVGSVKSPKTGETFRVQYDTSDFGEVSYMVYSKDGTPMGGVTIVGDQITMGLDDAARGVMDQIWDIADDLGDDLLALHGRSDSTTQAAVDFAQRYAQSRRDRALVFEHAVLDGSGGTKYAISNVDGSVAKNIDLDVLQEEAVQYLIDANRTDDAVAWAVDGKKITELSPRGQGALSEFVRQKGGHLGVSRDSVVVGTPIGRDTLVRGKDSIIEADDIIGPTYKDAVRHTYEADDGTRLSLIEAKMQYNDWHAKMAANDAQLWVIADQSLSLGTWTKRLRMLSATDSTSSWAREMRRSGYRITNRLPTGINLVRTNEGATMLYNWMKAIGATDTLADEAADAFRAGNVGTRQPIIRRYLEAAGEQIKDPFLKEGLIQFYDKPTMSTFFFGRNGQELGLEAGTIKPMTISHLSTQFPMPNAKLLLRQSKRYSQAKHRPASFVRGLGFTGTKGRRAEIANNLTNMARRSSGTILDPQDAMAMAYASVIGSEKRLIGGSVQGFGAVAQTAQLVHSAYSGLHNAFVIAQLAGRPIAWTSRVLLEEQARASLFGLPALFNNPYQYISDVMEARAIRQLPSQVRAQGKVADGLLNKMFTNGVDMDKLRAVMPGIDGELARAGISKGNDVRVRAFVANLLNDELGGADVTEGLFALRGQVEKEALRTRDRMRVTIANMDADGLMSQFRWSEDGQAIANRSVYQSFLTEAETATIPQEFKLGAMTPDALEKYGHSLGRQTYQMLQDPIIGSYGVNRAIDKASGVVDTAWNGKKLANSSYWPLISHIVDDRLDAKGLAGMSRVQRAEWYLDNIADEIVSTLFDPLAAGNLQTKADMLRGLRHGGKYDLNVSGVRVKLNAGADNYQGFVNSYGEVAQAAYNGNIQLPSKVAGYIDPRYGQADGGNIFRRGAAWTLNQFGEKPTQALHRQPAFLWLYRKNYNYYKSFGWGDEAARSAANMRSSEMVNYIFFDNNHIPQFLKDTNQYIPFFSAMWEVTSTWAYKIPSAQTLPVGYYTLGYRVNRLLRGLQKSGLVDYDPEENQMTLRLSKDMENAAGPVSAGIGRAMFEYGRLPATLMEQIHALGSLATGDGYDPGDYSAWTKDEFRLGIGNPLDPTTHGVFAVNQLGAGLSPGISWAASTAAERFFAMNDVKEDVEPGTTVLDWSASNPDVSMEEILRINAELFKEKNGPEKFNRALAGTFDMLELEMPDYVTIPQTSLWESLIDRTFFPYGKYHGWAEQFTAASPAALNHVWRGLLQRGGDWGQDVAGYLFGTMSEYQMGSEVIAQMMNKEYVDGSLTRAMELNARAFELAEELDLELSEDPNRARALLDPDAEGAAEVQALWHEADLLVENTLKETNNNASGSMILRGIMGELGPATPSMAFDQQKDAAAYWAAKDLAETAKATGSANYAEALASLKIDSGYDVAQLSALVSKFMEDSSGDSAKIWLREQVPGIMPFLQGKSFWGPAGPPPEVEGFDDWYEQLIVGNRTALSPEVWYMQYLKTTVSVDKEMAVVNQYGSNPDEAARRILNDGDAYQELVEPYHMKYDSLDFMDQYMFDGKWGAFKTTDLSDLSVYEVAMNNKRELRNSIENIETLLSYEDLDPTERKEMLGIVFSLQGQLSDATERQNELIAEDEFWRNPREQNLDRYDELNGEYRDGLNEIYRQDIKTRDERSQMNEEARNFRNDWYNREHYIDGFSGSVLVPAPEVKSWNARPEREKQARVFTMLRKNPLWLSAFEQDILLSVSPEMEQYLPSTPEQREIYERSTERKARIRAQWRDNLDDLSRSQMEKELREEDDWVAEQLNSLGRSGEAEWQDAEPFQRLVMADLVPQSLTGIVPVYNQIMADLEQVGKGPQSNEGWRIFPIFADWLHSSYYPANPTAESDMVTLGQSMFGDSILSSIYAKLFQGDNFGSIEFEEPE